MDSSSKSLRKLACAIYRDFFSAVNIENFIGKILIFFISLLFKILIVGTDLRIKSARQFKRVPTTYVCIKNKKNRSTPAHPSFI